MTLIAESIILGAVVSLGVEEVPKVNVTGILTLLENQAKSNATSSRVYDQFLNPVVGIGICLVSVILLVSHWG